MDGYNFSNRKLTDKHQKLRRNSKYVLDSDEKPQSGKIISHAVSGRLVKEDQGNKSSTKFSNYLRGIKSARERREQQSDLSDLSLHRAQNRSIAEQSKETPLQPYSFKKRNSMFSRLRKTVN